MNLTASTDFELAARLLGAYYREVMAQGMIQYPYHYEGAVCASPEPETWGNNFELSCDLPALETLGNNFNLSCDLPAPETLGNNFNLSCDLPLPQLATPDNAASSPVLATALELSPLLALSHTDASLEETLTVESIVNLPGNPPQSLSADRQAPAPENQSTPLPENPQPPQPMTQSPEERLQRRQAEEILLFYLYAQEIEKSGDLTRLPQVLRRR